jgi:hypothetical protein
MKSLSFLIFLCLVKFCSAQNVSAIDAITGISDYKFGAACETLNCKVDDYGWYTVYPNLSVGGLEISKVKLACNKSEGFFINGIYWIELYFVSKSAVDYQKIIDQLSLKYGPPTKVDIVNKARSWKGQRVTVTSSMNDISSEIVVIYDKISIKKEAGF